MSSDARTPDTGAAVIAVRSIRKVFPIYRRPEDRLKQMLFRNRRNFYTPFVALNGVSLTVGRGETIGIIGRNGSGKSTLLQIVAGLLQPTEGEVDVRGRLSALLQLGAGFNPSFTGRENVYLSASVQGLSRDEVNERFDRIVEFSGIAPYIDRPVETYSSGMFVRLAFAVAISVDPDILIVDEALAVGDEGFQRKCFGRIEELRAAGTTILFVSHAAGMITQLCDRAILLDRGEIIADGEPKQVISHYHRLAHAPEKEYEAIRSEIANSTFQAPSQIEAFAETMVTQSRVEYATRGALIENPRILTIDDKPVNMLARGRRYQFCYDVVFREGARSVLFGMMIKTKTGVELGGRAAHRRRGPLPSYAAGARVRVSFEFACMLNQDTYFLNCGVSAVIDGERTSMHRIMDAVMFRVMPDDEADALHGIVDFDVTASVVVDDAVAALPASPASAAVNSV